MVFGSLDATRNLQLKLIQVTTDGNRISVWIETMELILEKRIMRCYWIFVISFNMRLVKLAKIYEYFETFQQKLTIG